jgi:hypothetical protein
MKLFLDTEFTDLEKDNKLISIALVDENEEYFYAELTDTYKYEDCSSFVKLFVLPYLKGAPYQMRWIECAARIGEWIESRGVPCILACDNPSWDIPHLARMLDDIIPPNLKADDHWPLFFKHNEKEERTMADNLSIHNALDDAIVMKRVIMERDK